MDDASCKSHTSSTPVFADIVDNKICLGSALFCRTKVVPCTTDCFENMMKYKQVYTKPNSFYIEGLWTSYAADFY